MLKFIKKLFKDKKEPEIIKVEFKDIKEWLNQKVSKLDYNNYLQEYFKQIEQLKKQVSQKIKELEGVQISEKDYKGVEERVRNIVRGHRDNYVKETERFIRDLVEIEDKQFSTLKDYQEALEFNQTLDQKIEGLANRTAKSYQAAQHLFFDKVEAVFKSMGELNLLVKKTTEKIDENKLKKITLCYHGIENVNNSKDKQKDLLKNIEKLKKDIDDKKTQLTDKEKVLSKLKDSKDYKQLQEFKKEKDVSFEEIKSKQEETFTFFSKLSKPLKKYERIALDGKIINNYLDNSVKAFKDDNELKIKQALLGLKNNIDKLNIDKKQQDKFLELIRKSEDNYLDKLKKEIERLEEKQNQILNKIKTISVNDEMNVIKNEMEKIEIKIRFYNDEVESKNSKLSKINPEKSKEMIIKKIKELFSVEITLT